MRPLQMTDLTDNLFTFPYGSEQTGKMLTCGQTLDSAKAEGGWSEVGKVFNTKIVSQLCERVLDDEVKSNLFPFHRTILCTTNMRNANRQRTLRKVRTSKRVKFRGQK